MSGATRTANPSFSRPVLVVAASVLFAVLAGHVLGVLLDFKAAINYPGEFDYGEGIVWQQAVLMLGPRMYSPSQDLPFIVFHYPPLYYMVVRFFMALRMDPMVAGRLVSMLSALASMALVAALVRASVPNRPALAHIPIAVSAGAIMLVLNAARTWGAYMRVDLLAIALGLAATLVAIRSRGRLWMLTAALLLGVASVFTKQTQLPAGLAVFVVGVFCWPRPTIIAAVIAFAAGMAGVGLLQAATHGFLQNIIGANLNTYDWTQGINVLMLERSSFPFVVVMGVGALLVAVEFCNRGSMTRLRRGEPILVARAIVLVHFVLACLMAPTIFKGGSSNNYLLDLLTSGCVLIGILLCDLLRFPWRFAAAAILLALATANLPFRLYHEARLEEWARREEPIVASIRAANQPVAAEDMSLVMRAGKSLVFEPAIVEQLVLTGKWDPAPLLQMIHDRGFEFILTRWPQPMGGPQIAAAIAEAYPRTEQIIPNMWIHRPSDPRTR